jgi:DNA-binding CsgD family transcriptional regulator
MENTSEVIQQAQRDRRLLAEDFSGLTEEALAQKGRDAAMSTMLISAPNREVLTDLEQAILAQLAQGRSFLQVDSALRLESGTAWRARKPLFRKIGVRTRYQAAAFILSARQVEPEDLQGLSHRYHLNKREGQIIMLLLNRPDLSRKEIGTTLAITDSTVRHHMSNLYKKLRVSSRAEVVSMICTSLYQERGSDER